jgi:RHS repeat-associated protein
MVSPGQVAVLAIPMYYSGNSSTIDTVTLTVTPELYGMVQGPGDVMAAVVNRSTMTAGGLMLYPTITVTPTNGTTVTSSPLSQVRIDWCDANDAIAQHSVSWQGQILPDAYVATTRSGCFAAGTSTYSNLAINPWTQSLVATARDAAGNTTTSTTTITYSVPLSAYKPLVSATPAFHQLNGPGATTSIDTFTVKNNGTIPATYSLFAVCDGSATLSNCYMYKSQVTLDPGGSDVNVVYYSRAGTLDFPDTLKLVAKFYSPIGGVIADTGRKIVVAQTTYKPLITRYSPTAVSANGRRSFSFNILDGGNASTTYTVNVSCTGALTSCTLPNSSATTTQALSPNTWGSVAVGFNTGAGGSSGQIRLVMTAPPRPFDGVVQADTSLLTVNAADIAAPSVTIQSFGSPVTTNWGSYNYVSTDTATVLVDVCDIDGTVHDPTLTMSGVAVTARSVVATTVAGCSTSRRATYKPSFFDGYNDVTATVSDGYHTTTQQVWYEHDGAPQSTPRVTTVHPSLSVGAGYSGTDTFVVANTGPQTVTYLLRLDCYPNPYWLGCAMSQTYNSVTVAAGASVRVPFSYNVAGVGTSVTAYLFATFAGVYDTTGTSARFVATAAGTVAPTITVTPANGTTVTSSAISQVRIDWCDADDALVQHDVTWQGQALPDTYVATTRSGCYSAGTSTYNNLTINQWQQTLVATARDVASHSVTATANITYAPPLSTFAPRVTATTELRRLPAGISSSVADTFTVTNTGSSTAAYALAVGCGRIGTLANCAPGAGSLSLAPGASSTVVVQYTRAGAADVVDTLKLYATYTSPIGGVIADTGRKLVVAPSLETAPVVAAGLASWQIPPRAVGGLSFSVRNTGTATVTYAISWNATGGFTVRDFQSTTLTVDPGQLGWGSVNVLAPDTPSGTGSLSMTARYVTTVGATLAASATTQLTTSTSPSSGTATIAVSPKSARTVAANTSQTQRFTVTNSGGQVGSVRYTVSCAGSAIVSCRPPDHDSATIAASGSDAVSVVFTAAAANQTGTIKLIASAGGVADTGFVTITTGVANGPVAIVMNSLNPGASISRDQCLAIAVGSDAAYECGDLRLVHALPTTITMNKARTPTLIYTSAHAHPVSLIAADVAIDGASLGGVCPSQITATVRLANGYTTSKAFAWTGPCGQLATRRVVVPVNAFSRALLTGVYSYALEVSATSTATVADTSGKLVVVNREDSPFGPGWWIDGLEQLVPVAGHGDQLLWVGGDGTTRVYTRLIGDTLKYVVRPTIDRPDTLEKLPSGAGYKRNLRNGAFVSFDGVMRHIATVNTLGHATRFVWNASVSSQLDSIVLPTPGGATRRAYALVYTGGMLTAVTAPPGSNGSRVVTLSRGNADLAITDPGLPPIHYLSDAAGRVVVRQNRLNDGTRYAYDTLASVLTRAAIDMSRNGITGDSIRSSFCPAEAATIAACASALVDPAAVRTLFDGPRDDVQDTTAFYLTRFGAPRLIIDALGHPTIVERSDTLWPGLATKVVDARGHAIAARYDSARALLRSTTDFNPNASSAGVMTGDAVTSYTWDTRWDRVTEIVGPMNLTTHLTYDPSTGNRIEESVGSSRTSRTTFGYDSGTRLITSITTTQSPTPTRLDYDALGNLWHATTPKGFVTTTLRDVIGRDSIVTSPIDSSRTLFRTQSYLYDGADRLKSSVDSALSGSIAQASRVSNDYDPEDQLLTVSRSTTPDTAHVGTLIIDYSYDPAGRRLTEHDRAAPDGQVARWHYDHAGNVIEADTKALRIVSMRYDPLGRLSHREIPRIGNPYGSVDDIQDFTYDDVGNLLTATNPFAQVVRTYTLNGQIERDSLAIRAADLTVGGMAHGYRLVNRYDLAGRRVSQEQPGDLLWIASGSGGAGLSVAYGYDSETGALATVTDQRGNVYRYHYNSAGLLDSLLMPGGIAEARFYDDDGREVRRLEIGPMGVMHDDHSLRDAAGRALSVSVAGLASTGGSGSFTYAGLGSVTRSSIDLADLESLQLTTDGFGHTVKKQQAGTEADPGTKLYQYVYEPSSNRLLQINGQLGATGTDVLSHAYDAVGNLTQQSYAQTTPMTIGEGTSWIHVDAWWSVLMGYDAAGRLLTTDRATVNDRTNWQNDLFHRRTQAAINTGYGSFEEYRYDAIGRRIWKRTHRDSYCTNEARAQTIYEAECASAITVTLWDGDQALYEIRAAAADTLSSAQIEHNIDTPIGSGTPFGSFSGVTYLHGVGIDRPLELIRAGEVLVFHTSWRGAIDASTNTAGQFSTCGLASDVSCVNVKWPGQEMGLTYTRPYAAREAVPWYGDLSQGELDASGKMYMRNRYYDPTTGRFTQQDPIGLAGGMNLYGFGGGDQINFHDPFGLCFWDGCIVEGYATTMAAAGLAALVTAAYVDLTSKFGSPTTWFSKSSTSGETQATSGGRAAHKTWDAGAGFQKEFRLPSGKRCDALNPETCEIKELKPDNDRAKKRGEKQLKQYKEELERETGKEHKTILETYRPKQP